MAKSFNLVNKRNLFGAAFFLILAGLLWLLFSLLQPFLTSFVWAMILAMVFYPLYHRFYLWTGKSGNLAAFLATSITLAILAFPGTFILANLGQEVAKTYEILSNTNWDEKSRWLMEKFQALPLGGLLARWGVEPAQVEELLRNGITSGIQGFSKFVLAKVTDILKNLALFLMKASFIAIVLYFFFRDGARYARRIVELLPLSPEYQDKVVRTFSNTVSSVVRAMFVTALVQGLMVGGGFALLGIPLPILFGLITFVNSFIPFLGAASVWVPGVFWLVSQDRSGAAVALAVWGVAISLTDNFIKPLIIGGQAKLPLLLIFFTILGGLKLYGFLGVFLGPIILSMGLAFLSIYKEMYVDVKKPAPSRKSR